MSRGHCGGRESWLPAVKPYTCVSRGGGGGGNSVSTLVAVNVREEKRGCNGPGKIVGGIDHRGT